MYNLLSIFGHTDISKLLGRWSTKNIVWNSNKYRPTIDLIRL